MSKFWSMKSGCSEISVTELPSGKWLADVRLPPAENPTGFATKQKIFADVEEALIWLGYPVGFEINGEKVTVPKELHEVKQ